MTEQSGFQKTDVAGRQPVRIAVFSGKGGVGKTTVAVNLAIGLGQAGYAVGLMDADLTGPNVAKMLGIQGAPVVDEQQTVPHEVHGIRAISLASMLPADAPVIWRGPMRSKAIEQLVETTKWGHLDVLLFDLPPGTGDEILTISQQMTPELALIVTTPQAVARADASRAISFAKRLEIPQIGVIENMSGFVCPHCGEDIALFGTGASIDDAERLGVRHLGTIPLEADMPTEGDRGTPTILARPEGAAAQAIAGIAERLVTSILQT